MTTFYGDTITTTLEKLRKIFMNPPDLSVNKETRYYFNGETKDGDKFSVCDWKLSKNYKESDKAVFRILTFTKEFSEKAKAELTTKLKGEEPGFFLDHEVTKDIGAVNRIPIKLLSSQLPSFSTERLENIQKAASDAYHNTPDPIFDDKRYDLIVEELQKRKSTIPVGASLRTDDNATDLPFWMGSADKITPKNADALKRWLQKYGKVGSYLVSEKLDGVSCLFVKKGSKIKLYTRGDGKRGSDISYLAKYFHNIPDDLEEDIVVRGELIVSKRIFETKYSHSRTVPDGDYKGKKVGKREYKNPRNMVSGLVNSKTAREGLGDVEFVAYEIISDDEKQEMKPSEQMRKLGHLGFEVVNHTKLSTLSIPILEQSLEQMKKLSPYEIDGIIVCINGPYERNTDGNPDYLFAFKMTSEADIKQSTVRAVQWDISKTGQIKPVILIDPVEIDGVEVKQATAHHAKYVEENKLGPGAVVQIVRSGSVIPYIYSVLEQAEEPQMPEDEYVWDETHTNIRIAETTKENSQKMCVKLISDFFLQMGIKFVSEATVTKLYNDGLNTLLKIIGASKARIQQVDGIQERGAERIYTNIHEGLKNVKIHNVLGACGVLGYGVGKKRLEVLFQAKPDLLTWYKGKKLSVVIQEIIKVEGYSEIMARRVAENLPYAEKFYEAIKKYATFDTVKKNSPAKGSLTGAKIVMTGFRDKKLEEFVKSKGGSVVSAVSGAVTALVAADKNSATGKPKEARERGIPVYGREEYEKMVGFA